MAVLEGADLGTAYEVAERIRDAIEHLAIEIAPRRLAHLTVSIGATSTAAHGSERRTLLREADRALYRAKRAGRNRVVAAHTAAQMAANGADHAAAVQARGASSLAAPSEDVEEALIGAS